MASGKRASMREGPLAALFRRTDEDEAPTEGRDERPERTPEAPQPRAASPAPATSRPATAAGQSERRPAQPVADDRPRDPQRERPQQRAPERDPHHREPPPH